MAACSSQPSPDQLKGRFYENSFQDHVVKQSITISPSVHFSNPIQLQQLQNIAQKSSSVVCQIQTGDPNQQGSGFLIGGNLLITNHHILPDEATALKSYACFFQVTHQDPIKEETHVKIIRIAFDPSCFFFSCGQNVEGKGNYAVLKPADENHLDFTVVALKLHPYLSRVQSHVFNLFAPTTPDVGDLVCLIQHPHVIDAKTSLQGDLRISIGAVTKLENCEVQYNATSAPGSSGGAVISVEGKPIALHFASQQRKVGYTTYVEANCGILLNKIAPVLMPHKEAIDRQFAVKLPQQDSLTCNIINLPARNDDFTGRENEEEELSRLCLESRCVIVVGIAGIGKTTLLTKYANDHQHDYSLICVIQSGTIPQIELGLLNLANSFTMREGSLEERLLFLKTQLEHDNNKILLIFDGVDDEQTFAFLKKQLPERGCATILISSRLQISTRGSNFSLLSLQPFKEKDAVDFLLKVVGDKDTDVEQAKILAAELQCLPLALKHAAIFIKLTGEYNFNKYIDALKRKGTLLLGNGYVPQLGNQEDTILTTWKKSMDAIHQTPQGVLAEDLLNLFSLFSNVPIPKSLCNSSRL